MRYLLILLLLNLLTASYSYAETYELKDISKESTKYLCEHAGIGETILVNSMGGVVVEARKGGLCIKEKGIKLKVKLAVSAAPFLVMYSDNICTYSDTQIVVHSPYIPNKEEDIHELRNIIGFMISSLYTEAGYLEKDVIYFAGAMMLIPKENYANIPLPIFKQVLSYRYKGVCK